MKRYILPVVIIISFSNLFAQTVIDSTEIKNGMLTEHISVSDLNKPQATIQADLKGFDLISINGNYSYIKYDDPVYLGYTKTITDISINLGWSQFMYQNTAIGMNISYNRTSNTTIYSEGGSKLTYTNSYSMFGPKIGYYFGTRNRKYIPFIVGEYDFYVGKNTNYHEEKVGLGCIFQVKPKIGISIGADYIINNTDNINIQASLGLVGLLY